MVDIIVPWCQFIVPKLHGNPQTSNNHHFFRRSPYILEILTFYVSPSWSHLLPNTDQAYLNIFIHKKSIASAPLIQIDLYNCCWSTKRMCASAAQYRRPTAIKLRWISNAILSQSLQSNNIQYGDAYTWITSNRFSTDAHYSSHRIDCFAWARRISNESTRNWLKMCLLWVLHVWRNANTRKDKINNNSWWMRLWARNFSLWNSAEIKKTWTIKNMFGSWALQIYHGSVC